MWLGYITRSLEIRREHGVRELLSRIAPFIKYQILKPVHHTYMKLFHIILPVRRNAILNDVQVPPSIMRPRLYFDEHLPFYAIPDNKLKENGIVTAHKEYTESDDDVVIIAGGMGVSTVRAAREASDGELEVFEGGSEQAKAVKDVVDLHELEDRVTVHHAIVGEKIDVYGAGQTDSAKQITYDSIPDCDVLELDCEGSELEILRNLSISPRVIIVELHPYKAGEHLTAIFEAIDEAGYQIDNRYSNQGQRISHGEIMNILLERKSKTALPPVVVATRGT